MNVSNAQGAGESKVPGLPFQSYRQWAEKIAPQVEAALAGGRSVPPPKQSLTEAWLIYALHRRDSPLSLEDFLEMADDVNVGIPDADDVAWVFLRLRKRGWLAREGGVFALTAESRRIIDGIVSVDVPRETENVYRLNAWLAAHPLPGED